MHSILTIITFSIPHLVNVTFCFVKYHPGTNCSCYRTEKWNRQISFLSAQYFTGTVFLQISFLSLDTGCHLSFYCLGIMNTPAVPQSLMLQFISIGTVGHFFFFFFRLFTNMPNIVHLDTWTLSYQISFYLMKRINNTEIKYKD